MKVAKVSYTDSDGIEHAVTVEAHSLYHAIGLAIARFRTAEVECSPGSHAEFVVEPRAASSEHKVSHQQFDAWLAKDAVGSPAEMFQRSTIRELLKETERPIEPRRRKQYH